MADARELELVRALAKLADTLVDEYDVIDLLQMLVETCARTLDVDAAGILLADAEGVLEVVASTSESTRIVELMEIGSEAGPCIASYRSGKMVSVPDIEADGAQWAHFQASALEQGFRAVHAVPLRLRESRIGSLNLLSKSSGSLAEHDLVIAQALADVATIGILQNRALRSSEQLANQLQFALNSRVVIEQAKGVLSHVHGEPVDLAFERIRAYSRAHHVGIAEAARQIVERTLRL